MFNSPLLDTAIGLVFIFLLYSLLATSIGESIATLFGLRARMLKKGIATAMLSDTPNNNRWISIAKGVLGFLKAAFKLFLPGKRSNEDGGNIGDKFFDHPLIKNYGSNRVFSTPSYISTNNFSTVLLDLLKTDFNNKLAEIATYKYQFSGSNDTLENITQSLRNSSDAIKIKELLDYYGHHYMDEKTPPPSCIIDLQTWQILQMHLRNSYYNIEAFTKKIETWFDDSMARVSGWYKRQSQWILFVIGIFLAVIFNIDTIDISGKLSTDKDARDKMVQLAIQTADKYRDDPRVRKPDPAAANANTAKADSVNEEIFKQYNQKVDSVKALLNGDIANANNLLALGWGNYGRSDTGFIRYISGLKWTNLSNLQKINQEDSFNAIVMQVAAEESKLKKDTAQGAVAAKKPPFNRDSIVFARFYAQAVSHNPVRVKTEYVFYTAGKKKWLGFLITALAICLGAPFWFDLLNKLINLRASGKKEAEASDDPSKNKNNPAPASSPVTVNLNTNSNSGEEAVG